MGNDCIKGCFEEEPDPRPRLFYNMSIFNTKFFSIECFFNDFGVPKPGRYEDWYENWFAYMRIETMFDRVPDGVPTRHVIYWLYEQRHSWNSHPRHVKRQLVVKLLDVLNRRSQVFDGLFVNLFLLPDQIGTEKYTAVAADILRGGMEHRFLNNGRLENILDFPLKDICRYIWRHLCPCIRRPLYFVFYCGRPTLVRLLLNCGARLPVEDVCRCPGRNHPHLFDTLFLAVSTDEDQARRRQDLISLQLLLVDAPLPLRRTIRHTFPLLGDVTDDVPSLKHMVRARIRKQLRTARTIGRPNALKSCDLPKCLVSYIYMDDVHIGF